MQVFLLSYAERKGLKPEKLELAQSWSPRFESMHKRDVTTKISFLSDKTAPTATLPHLQLPFKECNIRKSQFPNCSPVLAQLSRVSSSKLLHLCPVWCLGNPRHNSLLTWKGCLKIFFFFSFLTISRRYMLVSTFHTCWPIFFPPHHSHKLVPDFTSKPPWLQRRY